MSFKQCTIVLFAALTLISGSFVSAPELFAQSDTPDVDASLLRDWDDFMHYSLIGKWELARKHGQALIDSNPNPVSVLELAESSRYSDSYRSLTLLKQDSPLRDIADEILKLVEAGRFQRRTDRDRIAV